MEQQRNTDWTEYYTRKKSFFSTVTQRFTLRELLKYIRNDVDIMELGGGNSCFAKMICRHRKIKRYDVIDNNDLAVRKYNLQKIDSTEHRGFLRDITSMDVPDGEGGVQRMLFCRINRAFFSECDRYCDREAF